MSFIYFRRRRLALDKQYDRLATLLGVVAGFIIAGVVIYLNYVKA